MMESFFRDCWASFKRQWSDQRDTSVTSEPGNKSDLEYVLERNGRLCAELEQTRQERDLALAEVERLRSRQ